VGGAVLGAIGLWFLWSTTVPVGGSDLVLVDLPAGMPARAIARRLRDEGVIRSAFWFRVLARVSRAPLKAGEYGFRRASMWRVLRSLQEARTWLHRILVREGDALPQIAAAVAAEGLCPAAELRRAASDGALLRSLGVPGASAEGFLFPDTYLLPKTHTPAQIVAVMARRFFAAVAPDTLAAGKRSGFDLLRLVTLASIVEREARAPEERPVIAGVFANRLRRGMPLQADPTVLYGLARWDNRLSLKDLKSDSPYNTYRHRGLPPGPICSPGLASIRAAAAPAATPFLYFVTRKDGTGRHQFSRTLAEHERAVRESKQRAAP
jgi:UPF0755 protein